MNLLIKLLNLFPKLFNYGYGKKKYGETKYGGKK